MIAIIFLWFFSFAFGFLLLLFVAFRMALYMDELEDNARRKKLRKDKDESL